MSVKLWNTEISKLYLWSTEITKAYLWTNEVYSTTSPNWLLNNLVSYYKMDTNGSFPDAHGSNDWTINGATYTASGKINGGYSFDGVNDYVDLSSDITLTSLSVWIKPDIEITTSNSSGLASKLTDPLGIRFWAVSVNATNEIITVVDWGNNNLSYWDSWDVPSITTDWHHIVIVYEWWTNYRLYYDGIDKWLSINWANWAAGQIALSRFWAYRTNPYFDWVIDEIGIWSRALTQTEITDLYNSWAWLSYDNFTT